MWILNVSVNKIHEDILMDGEMPGIRDEGLLESALARPRNAYGETDLHVLAAKYAFGICNNHPFIDGNKRTSFVVAYIFLLTNGLELIVDEKFVDDTMVDLATEQISEDEFAKWLSNNTKKINVREDDE